MKNKILLLILCLFSIGFSVEVKSLFIMNFHPDRNTVGKCGCDKITFTNQSESGCTITFDKPITSGQHLITYYKNGNLMNGVLSINDGWYSFKKFDPEVK